MTTGTIQAQHAYGDDGIYRVTVRVRDDDMQDLYLRAYIFWSNSVEAMALPGQAG